MSSFIPISINKATAQKTVENSVFDYLDDLVDLPTNGAVNSITYHEESNMACCCTGARISYIKLTEPVFSSHVSKFRRPSTSISFRSDGRLIAASDESGLVQVFNIETGSAVKRFYQLETPVYSVFFQDFTHVAACGRSGKLYVWDIASGDITFACQAHSDSIRVACRINENIICTTSYDGFVRFWDLSTKIVEDIKEDAASETFISYKRNIKMAREASGGATKAEPIIEIKLGVPIDSAFYDDESGALYIAADKRIFCIDVFGKLLVTKQEVAVNENDIPNKDSAVKANKKILSIEEVITVKSPIVLKGITSITMMKIKKDKEDFSSALNEEKVLIAGCADGTVRAFSLATLAQLHTICKLPSAVISVKSVVFSSGEKNKRAQKPSLFCGLITNKLVILCSQKTKNSTITEEQLQEFISNKQKLQDTLKERMTGALLKTSGSEFSENTSAQIILDKALEKLGEDSVELRRAKNSVMGQLIRLPRLDIDFVVTNEKPRSMERDLASKLSEYSSSFSQGLKERLYMINKHLKKYDYASALESACKKPVKSSDGTSANKLGSLLIFLTLLQELESRGNRTLQLAIARLSSNGLRYLYKYVGQLIGTEHAAIGIKAARFAIDVTTIGGVDSGKVMVQLHDLTKILRDELEVIQGLGEIEGMIEVLNF